MSEIAAAAAANTGTSAATSPAAAQPQAGGEAGSEANATNETNTETPSETPSKMDAWKNRYKQRFAPEAEEIDMEGDDYYDNLTTMTDEYDRLKSNETQMNDLLAANPSFSGMIRNAKEGKSFFPSLIEAVGVDKLKAALEDPEIAEEVSKASDAFMQRMQQENDDEETRQKNFEGSANNIFQYAQENNLSNEEVNNILVKASDFAKDIITGNFTPEIIEMFHKSMNYDNDVQQAREQGEVKGRNENIQAQLERSAGQPEVTPNIGNSGSMPTDSIKPNKEVINPLTGKPFGR